MRNIYPESHLTRAGLGRRVRNKAWLGVILLAAALLAIAAMPARAVADCFQFPLSNYSVTGYNFGTPVPDSNNSCYTTADPRVHLGEDAHAPAGTAVYAAGEGYVKHTATATSFGHVVIIEHTLPDGSKVCTLYGHLRDRPEIGQGIIANGSHVNKGDRIGYTGTKDENGGWEPHLHFGVRPGGYTDGVGAHCSPWVYSGYGCRTHDQPKWTKPTDFINAHANCGSGPCNPDYSNLYVQMGGSGCGTSANPLGSVFDAFTPSLGNPATIHIHTGAYPQTGTLDPGGRTVELKPDGGSVTLGS